MSKVYGFNEELTVVQEVDGKDKTSGREWHSMKANFGRLEKKFKMDLQQNAKFEWPTVGYRFIASREGLKVEKYEPPPL